MARVLSDIRYSARSFARTPGVTAALLFTIALGIGSNVAVQAFVHGMMQREAPAGETDGLVSVFARDGQRIAAPVTSHVYRALRQEHEVFEWVGAAHIAQQAVTLSERTTVLSVGAVSPEVAQALGLTVSEEADLNAQTLDRTKRTGLYGDRAVDLWIPLREDADKQRLWVLAKLRPGVSIEEAEARHGEIRLLPYTGMTPELAEGFTRVRTLLGVAAGFVFFIACANVASLLLGRASRRAQETSLRVALGAGRRELARSILADSLVIAIAGGALGMLLALWTSKVIPALLFAEDAEHLTFAPDIRGIVLASAACAAIVILCGLVPLVETPHRRPADVLRRESSGPSRTNRVLRSVLVVAQMTCCCVLVIATGFLLDSFRATLQTTTAHELGQPVLASVLAGSDGYFPAIERTAQRVTGRVRMSWTAELPGGQPARRSFRVEPVGLPLRDVTMDTASFTVDLLESFRLPLRAGRLFGAQDRGCNVGVINEAAADALFGRETVGRTIREAAGWPTTIIGIASYRGAQSRRPTIYYDYTDRPGRAVSGSTAARFRAAEVSNLQSIELNANVVSANYFGAVGSKLLDGRWFRDGEAGCRVALVNQEAHDLLGGNAIGTAVIDEVGRRTEIVGVVQAPALGAFQQRAEPTIYFPMTQDYLPHMTLLIGTEKTNDEMLKALFRELDAVPGRGPAPVLVKTLEAHLRQTALAPLRIAATMIGAFAATGLALSLIGLYGTLNDAARQRGRELAVRFALGAQRRHVIGQMLGEGGRLAGSAILTGILGAFVLGRVLPSVAARGAAPSVWVWCAGPAILCAAVVVASVLPARRALMVDPARLLRE